MEDELGLLQLCSRIVCCVHGLGGSGSAAKRPSNLLKLYEPPTRELVRSKKDMYRLRSMKPQSAYHYQAMESKKHKHFDHFVCFNIHFLSPLSYL